MIRSRLTIAAAIGLAALIQTSSLAAQDASVPTVEAVPADDSAEPSGDVQAMAALAGMMDGMPKAEPLTAEQQARLPQAEQIIAKIWPVGAAAELSQSMFGGLLGGCRFDFIIPR